MVLAGYLGDSVERARQLFEHCWQLLRPQLCGRPACRPRIWNT
jgi:urease accessory protein